MLCKLNVYFCGHIKSARLSHSWISGNFDKFHEMLEFDWGNVFLNCGNAESTWSITCHYTRYYTIVVVCLIPATHVTMYLHTYTFSILHCAINVALWYLCTLQNILNVCSSATSRCHDSTKVSLFVLIFPLQ